MKRRSLVFLLLLSMTMLLPACGRTVGESTAPQESASAPTKQKQKETAPLVGEEDTYWVAYEWYGEDGYGADGPHSMKPAEWTLDLMICADGTARFRDIAERLYLTDDDTLYLTWEKEDDGTFSFYGDVYPMNYLRAGWEDDVFTVEYAEISLSMKQAEMPKTVGTLYSPAELAGTWLMVSCETEGDEWEAVPSRLESLSFKRTFSDENATLLVDREVRDCDGTLTDSAYGEEVTILSEPLRADCENEAWSVRIGPEAPKDSNGDPTDTEYYVTLVEQNTLLMKHCYMQDGAPGVSYQTFRRIPERISWGDADVEEIVDTEWICTGYTDRDGNAYPMPPGLSDFYLHLNEDGTSRVSQLHEGKEDYTVSQCSWLVGSGDVFLLRAEEESNDSLWYAGAIRWGCLKAEQDGEQDPQYGYEIYLYDDGGLIHLEYVGHG